MSEPSEVGIIRRLPDGAPHPARIVNREADRLSVSFIEDPSGEFKAGTLVEIDSPQALYLGEIASREPDSFLTITVEHFIDHAALDEIQKSWNA